MHSQRAHAHHVPDPVLADAIYSFEDGGLNPVRDKSSRWKSNGANNCLTRYKAIRGSRSCYQGFWSLSLLEWPPFAK
jgi:hypothetical protein